MKKYDRARNTSSKTLKQILNKPTVLKKKTMANRKITTHIFTVYRPASLFNFDLVYFLIFSFEYKCITNILGVVTLSFTNVEF